MTHAQFVTETEILLVTGAAATHVLPHHGLALQMTRGNNVVAVYGSLGNGHFNLVSAHEVHFDGEHALHIHWDGEHMTVGHDADAGQSRQAG